MDINAILIFFKKKYLGYAKNNRRVFPVFSRVFCELHITGLIFQMYNFMIYQKI